MKPYKASVRPPVAAALVRFGQVANAIAEEHVSTFAETECAAFRERISHQDFVSFWRIPLAPATVARKEELNLDKRVMIATGHYVESIRVFKKRTKGLLELRIGFHPQAQARDADGKPAGVLLNTVALTQEYGSAARHVPARPHWRPHELLMTQHALLLRKGLPSFIVSQWRKGKLP